jgi:hypothetical protein
VKHFAFEADGPEVLYFFIEEGDELQQKRLQGKA